jgi:hypothetical protein
MLKNSPNRGLFLSARDCGRTSNLVPVLTFQNSKTGTKFYVLPERFCQVLPGLGEKREKKRANLHLFT